MPGHSDKHCSKLFYMNSLSKDQFSFSLLLRADGRLTVQVAEQWLRSESLVVKELLMRREKARAKPMDVESPNTYGFGQSPSFSNLHPIPNSKEISKGKVKASATNVHEPIMTDSGMHGVECDGVLPNAENVESRLFIGETKRHRSDDENKDATGENKMEDSTNNSWVGSNG
ncbi:hypothetical protein JCGZ_18191 [Jatropha curcas]|uniref:Uncharacterized protein n=1 Tax=Jatropha curcas TaxID=180498 RepID=A0A067K545_JATCU|nr:hypothetical protein JCGZ_18191 [Jatropha curcas]